MTSAVRFFSRLRRRLADRGRSRPVATSFVKFADGRFDLVEDGRTRLSIPLTDVTAVGEFTNSDGPWFDDYFMVLRYRTGEGEKELQVPFNGDSGADDAYKRLLAALGAPRTFCLVNRTCFASVFLWPPDRAGTPIWPDRAARPEGGWPLEKNERVLWEGAPNPAAPPSDAIEEIRRTAETKGIRR